MVRCLGIVVSLWWLVPSTSVLAQQAATPTGATSPPGSVQGEPATNRETASPGTEAAPPGTALDSAEKPSDADRAAQLTQSIEKDSKLLEELKAKIDPPEGEFSEADQALKALHQELEAKKDQLGELTEQGKTDEAAKLSEELQALEKKHNLAQERFEIAFEEQKALKEQVRLLQEKIVKDRQTIERLSGTVEAPSAATDAATEAASPSTPPGARPEDTPQEEAATPAATVPGVIPGLPATAPAAEPKKDGAPSEAAPAAEETRPVGKALQKAKEELAQKEQDAEKVTQDAVEIQGSVQSKTQEIENTRKLVATARKKADLAEEERASLDEELQRKIDAGAPAAELAEVQRQIRDAQDRYREAQKEAREYNKALDRLYTELDGLRKQEYLVLEAKKETEEELRQKEKEVRSLQNPFHWRNLLQWMISHGPPIALILVLMYAANWLSRLLSGRIVSLVAKAGTRGATEERENRAKTLVGVFHNTAYVAIIAGGSVMILQEVGVPVGPLLGGAAIAGLAVAFGAQRLIGDYFHGFVILLENQYMVNDVVRIAGISGLVERITMRMTVLRDLEGCVHFVPNGEIKTVTNMTHGWSRALFDIGVGYGEDPDEVMPVLVELGKELRKDPKFAPLILADPEMLGLDQLGDSALVFKFFIKTRPLQQWTVKREMLRRIKKKFDELGIEIPFPHRTVYMRAEASAAPESRGSQGSEG